MISIQPFSVLTPSSSGSLVGYTWTSRTLPSNPNNDNFYGITTDGGNVIVGSGSNNYFFYSLDGGVTWASGFTPIIIRNWYTIAYGNGVFVMMGDSVGGTNSIATSPDGFTWTMRSSPTTGLRRNLRFLNGLFVSVSRINGANPQIMTSPDGINWTTRTAPLSRNWNDVTYGNGIYAAVALISGGQTEVMTSPDAITWTSQTSNIPIGATQVSIAFGNGRFVIVGDSFSTVSSISSTNALTWTDITPTGTDLGNAGAYMLRVSFLNGNFCAIGSGGSTYCGSGLKWIGDGGALPGVSIFTDGQGITTNGSKFFAIVIGGIFTSYP